MRRWFIEWCQTEGQTPGLLLSLLVEWCQTEGQTPECLSAFSAPGLTSGLTQLSPYLPNFIKSSQISAYNA
jgi:hypothetical protein